MIGLILFSKVYSQREVTKFMDIPVDGKKSEMIKQLKKKGFKHKRHSFDTSIDYMEGEFNGCNVDVYIVTNKKKVWRIAIEYNSLCTNTSIIPIYNRLCSQFENNIKYKSASDSTQAIPKDEDISYMMSIKNKRYNAIYYQLPNNITEGKTSITIGEYLENLAKRVVWFTIKEDWYGKEMHGEEYYRIQMYYDNLYNQSDGEDL